MMRKSGKKKQPDAIDEVEELLKLTQDDLLLKLTVNSPYTKSKSTSKFPESSRSSNATIDPDLDRRFQALRSKSKPKTEIHQDADDLFARFAALKPPNASSSAVGDMKHDVEEADEEDEVQKIIDWAVDAARLDPSLSDEDVDEDVNDDSDDDSDDDDDDDDDDYDEATVGRKKKASKK